MFLGKGFDHADSGNRVGQDAGHVSPGAATRLKSAPQTVPHLVDEPGDQRHRQQCYQRQMEVLRCHEACRQDDQQHVIEEVHQVDLQEVADPIGIGADARDQVAGSFAAKKLQRQPLEVRVRFDAQIGGDAFAHPGQDIGTTPGQEPRDNRGDRHAKQIPRDDGEIGRLRFLVWNEHIVDHRLRQVRRNQAGRGGGQRQCHAEDRHAGVMAGETDQPQQRSSRPDQWC